MPLGARPRRSSSCSRWLMVADLLSVALRWKEPEAEGGGASSPPSIKLDGFSHDLDGSSLDPLLLRHHGGGIEDEAPGDAVLGRSPERHPGANDLRAQHMATELVAVILGQHGGPSSTSRSEALRFICWSSTPPEDQVVRPRHSGGCQWRNLLAGMEYSSMQLLELGGDAWSSPAKGGRGTVLDCFFSYNFRVLSVKCEKDYLPLDCHHLLVDGLLSKGSLCQPMLLKSFSRSMLALSLFCMEMVFLMSYCSRKTGVSLCPQHALSSGKTRSTPRPRWLQLHRLRHQHPLRRLPRCVSVTLLARYALPASFAATSTLAPDHDIDHDNPSHDTLHQGCTAQRSWLPRHRHKGYHLARAPRLPLQSKHPRCDIVYKSTTLPLRLRGVSARWCIPSVSLQSDRPRRFHCSRHYRYDCGGVLQIY
nr:uncharacterized protein LOC127310183 [Lolium perenne]